MAQLLISRSRVSPIAIGFTPSLCFCTAVKGARHSRSAGPLPDRNGVTNLVNAPINVGPWPWAMTIVLDFRWGLRSPSQSSFWTVQNPHLQTQAGTFVWLSIHHCRTLAGAETFRREARTPHREHEFPMDVWKSMQRALQWTKEFIAEDVSLTRQRYFNSQLYCVWFRV